jgi:hypothetical protein
VRNRVSSKESYFARIKGRPTSLLIMPDEANTEAEAAEAYVVSLN